MAFKGSLTEFKGILVPNSLFVPLIFLFLLEIHNTLCRWNSDIFPFVPPKSIHLSLLLNCAGYRQFYVLLMQCYAWARHFLLPSAFCRFTLLLHFSDPEQTGNNPTVTSPHKSAQWIKNRAWTKTTRDPESQRLFVPFITFHKISSVFALSTRSCMNLTHTYLTIRKPATIPTCISQWLVWLSQKAWQSCIRVQRKKRGNLQDWHALNDSPISVGRLWETDRQIDALTELNWATEQRSFIKSILPCEG